MAFEHSALPAAADWTMQGTYRPQPQKPQFGDGKPYKDIQLDTTRAKYWLGVGAQPSDPMRRMLSLVREMSVPFRGLEPKEANGALLIQLGLIQPKYSVLQTQQKLREMGQRVEAAEMEGS